MNDAEHWSEAGLTNIGSSCKILEKSPSPVRGEEGRFLNPSRRGGGEG
jgi:hypothetical protein